MEDGRQKVSEAALVEVLIQEIGGIIGRDANFVGERIKIQPREGTPNWHAKMGPAGATVTRAFVIALKKVKSKYDVG
jgi:hypothetical protein